MAEDCKEVILETAPRLVDMMRRAYPMITVEGTLKEQTQNWSLDRVGTDKQIDAHIHISHIGKFYRNDDKDFPRKAYLKVDEELVQGWNDILKDYPKPWVGIAWKGGILSTQTHIRSMELSDLAAVIRTVARKGGTVFDLSYQDNRHEVSLWNIDNTEQVVIQQINEQNFDATLSFIYAMDEIVTVTTTVAHVCGALGKRAHVLVPSVPQWRYAYRMEDEGMIWYPKDSVRLFRQTPGEEGWGPTVARATKELNKVL
jgi:hypothetical protein